MSQGSTLPAWFARALASLRDGDVDGYLAIYAPDAVHEFPFAPEGGVPRLEGLEAIAAYMRQLPGRVRFGHLEDVSVREVGDEVIVEATAHHRRTSDDAPRELGCVWFVTLRDGKVTRFRDYMNPRQLSAL